MRTSDLLPAQLYLKVAVAVWECQYTSSCPLSPSLLSLKDSTLPGVMPCGCPSCILCSRISSSSTMCSYPHGRPSPLLSSVCLACAFLFYYRTPFAGGAGCNLCISFYAHMPLLSYLWVRAQAGVYDIQSTIASIFFFLHDGLHVCKRANAAKPLPGCAGYYIFRSVNEQKDRFRMDPENCTIWGKKATYIKCAFTTSDGSSVWYCLIFS